MEPAGRLVYVVLLLLSEIGVYLLGYPYFLYDLRCRSLVPPLKLWFLLIMENKILCFVSKFSIVHLKHVIFMSLLITKEEKHFSVLSSFCRTVVKNPKTLGNPNSEMKDTNLVMVQKQLFKTSISSCSRVNFW